MLAEIDLAKNLDPGEGLTLEEEEFVHFDYMDADLVEVWNEVDEDAEAVLVTERRVTPLCRDAQRRGAHSLEN